jgi:hypothetical protein
MKAVHVAYPSFGSLIDFKLMYSSYSNVPNGVSCSISLLSQINRTVEFRVLPMEGKLRPQKVNVLFDELAIA